MRDLGPQLREDAARLTPAFDEALHARTMQRVQAARRERLVATVRAPAHFSWRLTAGALTMSTIAAALTIWATRPAEPTPAQVDAVIQTCFSLLVRRLFAST